LGKQIKRRVGGPAWKPGEPTITIGELAERLKPIAPDIAGTVNRIMHWTREQMLLPVDRHHAGTGKHRRYAADAIYDAAILHVTTSAGLKVSSQRYLVDALTMARIALPKWRAARGRGGTPPLYLRLSRSADAGEQTEVGIEPSKLEEENFKIEVKDDFTIIIDLAKLFARIGG
jgi:DNA-binding transcriptional MerR regulator